MAIGFNSLPTKSDGWAFFSPPGADLLLGLLRLPALRPLPIVGEVGQLPGLRRSCQVRKSGHFRLLESTFDAIEAHEIDI